MELELTVEEAKLLYAYFMKAGYISYEVPELHKVIDKITKHAEGDNHASIHGRFGYASRDTQETV